MSMEPPDARSTLRGLALVRTAAISPAGIALLTVCCLVAAELRRSAQLDPGYGFLRWNLFLAWVPFVLAYALAWASRRGATAVAVPMLAACWIAFLPNAPYLVTDLVHLRVLFSIPNAITLGLLALVGLLIGVKSVQIVQRVVEEYFGARAGWRAVNVMVGLIAVGVYLGRVLRLNSWNLISHPRELARAVLTGIPEPGRAAVALVATIAFAVAFYVAYRILTAPSTGNGVRTAASARELER